MNPNDQTLVGTFPLCNIQFDLYARGGDGGEFYFNPEPENHARPRIKVGLAYNEWAGVLNVLIHEVFEAVFSIMNLRYMQDDQTGDHGNYLFVMNHSQFSSSGEHAAAFLAVAVPELARVYEESVNKEGGGE